MEGGQHLQVHHLQQPHLERPQARHQFQELPPREGAQVDAEDTQAQLS